MAIAGPQGRLGMQRQRAGCRTFDAFLPQGAWLARSTPPPPAFGCSSISLQSVYIFLHECLIRYPRTLPSSFPLGSSQSQSDSSRLLYREGFSEREKIICPQRGAISHSPDRETRSSPAGPPGGRERRAGRREARGNGEPPRRARSKPAPRPRLGTAPPAGRRDGGCETGQGASPQPSGRRRSLTPRRAGLRDVRPHCVRGPEAEASGRAASLRALLLPRAPRPSWLTGKAITLGLGFRLIPIKRHRLFA